LRIKITIIIVLRTILRLFRFQRDRSKDQRAPRGKQPHCLLLLLRISWFLLKMIKIIKGNSQLWRVEEYLLIKVCLIWRRICEWTLWMSHKHRLMLKRFAGDNRRRTVINLISIWYSISHKWNNHSPVMFLLINQD